MAIYLIIILFIKSHDIIISLSITWHDTWIQPRFVNKEEAESPTLLKGRKSHIFFLDTLIFQSFLKFDPELIGYEISLNEKIIIILCYLLSHVSLFFFFPHSRFFFSFSFLWRGRNWQLFFELLRAIFMLLEKFSSGIWLVSAVLIIFGK